MTRQEAFEKSKGSHINHADSIALCRVGDCYESYGIDAIELNLTCKLVSARDPKIGAHVSGFPHHELDHYLSELVRAGNRVAIYE